MDEDVLRNRGRTVSETAVDVQEVVRYCAGCRPENLARLAAVMSSDVGRPFLAAAVEQTAGREPAEREEAVMRVVDVALGLDALSALDARSPSWAGRTPPRVGDQVLVLVGRRSSEEFVLREVVEPLDGYCSFGVLTPTDDGSRLVHWCCLSREGLDWKRTTSSANAEDARPRRKDS